MGTVGESGNHWRDRGKRLVETVGEIVVGVGVGLVGQFGFLQVVGAASAGRSG